VNKWLFLCFVSYLSAASAEITQLPDSFTVAERFLSLSSTFDIGTEAGPFALARKRFLSLTATFDLEDLHQQPLATATARFFSWGTAADVIDPAGNKIGSIEEEIFHFLSWAEYRVFNNENQIVAIAKMNFWGTHFELCHPDNANEVYATIRRPLLNWFRNFWTVQIQNTAVFAQGAIDPRLLIILAIYQTDKEMRNAYRSQFTPNNI
jgi:uncharacterized protein YxjI